MPPTIKKVLSIRSLQREMSGIHNVENYSKEPQVLHRELAEYGRRRGTEWPYNDNLDVDVLIVGAGFGGVYLLHEMRKAGHKVAVYEAGTSFGGELLLIVDGRASLLMMAEQEHGDGTSILALVSIPRFPFTN
jgi:NADH dehydrogenase FAD-containing subunit